MNSRFRVQKVLHFCAAHQLLEGGDPGSIHGHTYRVEITLSSESLENGMVVDLRLLEELRGLIGLFDHKLLLPLVLCDHYQGLLEEYGSRLMVTDYNPTVEQIALDIHDRVRQQIAGLLRDNQHRLLHLDKVRVYEDAEQWGEYEEPDERTEPGKGNPEFQVEEQSL